MKELTLDNISSRMGGEEILQSVSLSMERGERLCLLGPSGCGKTSLLRIAAGLDPFQSGDVLFRGKSIRHLPPHQRNFGMMFQDFALFPHRNVMKNIAFGLEMKKLSAREINIRVDEMLELVGLSAHGRRQVSALSGGERQRVALARSLAPAPDLIMLDEPLGALDRLLRERLLSDLCTILDKTRMTTILVTHDQQEAFAVADRICVMNRGAVAQVDSPVQLYNHPVNVTVADFLGFQNLIPPEGFTIEADTVRIGQGDDCAFFSLPCDVDVKAARSPGATLLFLPDGGTIVPPFKKNARGTRNIISGTLGERFFQGSMVRIRMTTASGLIFFFDVSARGGVPQKGQRVDIAIDPASIRMIPGREMDHLVPGVV